MSPRPFIILVQPSRFDATRAPTPLHTAWAYCHVPAGSDFDGTELIESEIERFAPGFRDTIVARAKKTTSTLSTYNENYVGGDINGASPLSISSSRAPWPHSIRMRHRSTTCSCARRRHRRVEVFTACAATSLLGARSGASFGRRRRSSPERPVTPSAWLEARGSLFRKRRPLP